MITDSDTGYLAILWSLNILSKKYQLNRLGGTEKNISFDMNKLKPYNVNQTYKQIKSNQNLYKKDN